MLDSDSRYHQLFSHPRMVEDLVREFVPDATAIGLDFSGLQRINAKFHVGRRSARRRESDVIWKLPTREGVDIYLYLLIEFQTRSDWWMAVRTQVYQGLLWQQIIQENKLKTGARLPPVLLLVLHNGKRRWKAPTEIAGLIALPSDSALWHWQPQVRYYLLDVRAFAADELAGRTSLAALLFRLEQRLTPDQLKLLVADVVCWFRKHPSYGPLQQLFRELVHQAADSIGTDEPIPEDLEEMKAMLWTYGPTWREEWTAEGRAEGLVQGKAEGRAEGKVEGRAEGLAEGEVKALVRLLVRRFGPLESSLHTRIQAADLAMIESWFERAIDAPDLTAVFDPPG